MRVLVTGGTGFVGSRIVHALRASGTDVRVLSRSRAAGESGERIVGDLSDSAALESAVADVNGIVHAAAAVQGDPRTVEEVNAGGTERVLAAARAAGVSAVVYVSTTAVYGSGPHRAASEGDLLPSPESPASRSRLRAETAVLASGGKIVRSALTYGVGDRWFIPSLLRGVFALGGLPDGGNARLSVVDVDVLGRAVAEVMVRFADIGERVLHAAHPAPVAVGDMLDGLADATGLSLPRSVVPREVAAAAAERLGFTPHQFALIADDHWYYSSRLWRSIGVVPPPAFSLTSEEAAWYREVAESLRTR